MIAQNEAGQAFNRIGLEAYNAPISWQVVVELRAYALGLLNPALRPDLPMVQVKQILLTQ